jgi:hypothetical protein
VTRRNQEGRFLYTIARLKPGVSIASAQGDMDAVAASLRRDRPAYDAKWGSYVESLQA